MSYAGLFKSYHISENHMANVDLLENQFQNSSLTQGLGT